jgi:hypothetical protein
MAERATLFQQVHIGAEGASTPGTAVATVRNLASLSIEPNVKVDVGSFRPMGSKFTTLTSLNKEWSEAKMSGQATYTEIVYPLSSVITRSSPVVGTAMVGGTAYTWTFSPNQSGADTPCTFTVDQGSSDRAHRITNAVVTDLSIDYKRGGIELSGGMIGKQLQDGIAFPGTTNVSSISLVPVLPTQVAVTIGTSPAHLNQATALTRAISASWGLSSRFGPIWTLDSRESSWAALVETEPKLDLKLMVEADAAGMALLPLVRSGETRFLRIEAVGDTIPGTDRSYGMRVDTAFRITDVGSFSDSDGVYALEYSLSGVSDGTYWGGTATVVTVTNGIASL